MFGSKIKMQNIYTPFDFKGSEPLFIASWFDFDHRNTVMESWMCTIWPHLWIDITNDADLPQTANATGTKLSDAMSLLSIYMYIWLYVIMWFHVDCVGCMKPAIQPIAFRARVLWGLLTSTLGQMATHYFQLGSLSFCSCKNRGNNYCRLEQPEPHSWFENQHQVTQTLKCSSVNASGSGSVDKPWGTQKKINKERCILHCNWCLQRPLWTQPRGNPWACSEGGDTCTARKPCAAGGWKLCKPSKSNHVNPG